MYRLRPAGPVSGHRVDRFTYVPGLVRSRIPWRPSDPAPLPDSYLDAVARYLEADDETPAQQGSHGAVTHSRSTHESTHGAPPENVTHEAPTPVTVTDVPAGQGQSRSRHAHPRRAAHTLPGVSIRDPRERVCCPPWVRVA